MAEREETGSTFDALLPAEVARRAEEAGVAKARRDGPRLIALAIFAGAFIAFGALASTIALAGADGVVPWGLARLMAGVAFSLGLMLVVVAGAELFTGDTLMVMAWASGRVRLSRMLAVWALVYVGNAIGAIGTAVLVFLAGHHAMGGGAPCAVILASAEAKCALPFGEAVARGVLCNVLVCMGVWVAMSARSVADKILAVVPPVATFVAAGFEHSIANLYIVPLALLIEAFADEAFWRAIGTSPDSYRALSPVGLIANLIPVTIGNFIGGAVMVGLMYWFIFLRR
jgi:formate/nitrite transporter